MFNILMLDLNDVSLFRIMFRWYDTWFYCSHDSFRFEFLWWILLKIFDGFLEMKGQ
jgi:hypothetical protein